MVRLIQSIARKFSRLTAAAALAALALSAWGAAPAAAEYPERPIRFVIGFPAGGGADILARWYVDKVREISGATVLLENKPGASGNLASDLVAKAKPDGYTLMLVGSSGLAGNMFIYKDLPFDSIKDFQPIVGMLSLGFAVTVAANSPANSIPELVTLLKAKGSRATFGWGTSTGLASGSLFLKKADVPATVVSYKTNAAAVGDVATGQIDFCVADMTFVLSQAKLGKVKILAVTSPKRTASAPDVPAMNEFGYDTGGVAPHWAVLGPVGLPKEVTDKITKWFNQVSAMPETKAFLLSQAGDPWAVDGPTVAKLLSDQIATWRQVSQIVNLSAQ